MARILDVLRRGEGAVSHDLPHLLDAAHARLDGVDHHLDALASKGDLVRYLNLEKHGERGFSHQNTVIYTKKY